MSQWEHYPQSTSVKCASRLLNSCLVSSLLVSASLSAQQIECNRHTLAKIDQTISVDGKLDEAVWQQATKMELAYENNPGEGTPAPVKTEVFFYHDEKSLYVAFKAYDDEPEKIRASLRDRDALWADDNVGIIVDTFNDQRGGFEFFVNPLGAQADMKMDDSDGWREDASWDAIWDSAGQITDFGYVVEMSIPFSSLRFPETEGAKVWNIAGWRNYPRDVRVQMATHKRDRDIKCNLCQFEQIVGLKGITSGNNVQLTPTLTVSRQDEKDEVPGPWKNGDIDAEPGLDIRWGITQDMVLNATLNPDFSQVEADAGQLNVNSTDSLFYSEKRPFFLDGASYFDTTNFNFVHTRNIADPDVGVKLTGKSQQHSYGVMLANDSNTSFLMPENQGSGLATLDESSNVAIARYKNDVGERNNVGVLMTHRNSDNYHNTLLSVDGTYWFSDKDNFRYQVARSQSKNSVGVMEDFDVKEKQNDHALSVNYSHSTRDYNLRANYTNIGEDFRADLGFQSRSDIERYVLGGNRYYYGDKDDLFTRWGYFGDWDKTYDQDGKLLEEEYEIHGNLQGKKQFFSNFGIVHRNRHYDGQYYNENQFMMFAEFKPFATMTVGNFLRIGKQIDFSNSRLGDVLDLQPHISWDVNEHLKLSLNHNYSQLKIGDKRLFTANQSDIRIGYQFDMHSILKFVVQYTDIDRNQDLYLDKDDLPDEKQRYFSTQLIYSYKINPQTLFFIGYSDGGFQDDSLDSIERDQRTVFTKFSYAWQL
ncbi:carbohydrate binding family 9 domain-containing protein [Thalassotalea sp. G2M2-11]|uniref:carbohydrate binding family 9 domain-containing protein n=1 Tax=Thalassotalea sp. G2M2-11 TaxID=2787627 RepID=UPI0019D0A2A1|nr:carbohydrate binding family 9 domain-containing protein [Thalassotalea sp. G2M2-11]